MRCAFIAMATTGLPAPALDLHILNMAARVTLSNGKSGHIGAKPPLTPISLGVIPAGLTGADQLSAPPPLPTSLPLRSSPASLLFILLIQGLTYPFPLPGALPPAE